MSGKELKRVEVLSRVQRGELKLTEAADLLEMSCRQAKRLKKRYRWGGSKALVHGNVGRASNRADDERRQRVLDLVRTNDSGAPHERFGPTLASEPLASDHRIEVPRETLRRWMLAAGLWSRRGKRQAHRQRRQRKAHFGELIQVDGSHHPWLEERGPKGCLMNFVDDATGVALGRFSSEETTWAAADLLAAAVAAGYHTFGVSEHAPRGEERFVYTSEREKGYDLARLHREFDEYARTVFQLAEEFADRLVVLRGFEAEVVPRARYREEMLGHRAKYGFDYMVGSVHYVGEIPIDGEKSDFRLALDRAGGLEPLAVRYYNDVAEMAEALRPEVAGHLDLIRKNAGPGAVLDTQAIRKAADRALEAIRARECILDLNTAGYRKGLGSPYPEPWLVKRAHAMGIGFCFGDDSHGPAQVGMDLDQARAYLMENGVGEITILTRRDDEIVRRRVSLG